MDMGWMVPVGVVGAVSIRQAFVTWVRAKHGYPLESRRSRKFPHYARYPGESGSELEADRKIMLLENENEKLTGQVSRLEERLRACSNGSQPIPPPAPRARSTRCATPEGDATCTH